MSDGDCYLDTSALLPYYREESASGAVEAFLRARGQPVREPLGGSRVVFGPRSVGAYV